jgi:hypothetical protein
VSFLHEEINYWLNSAVDKYINTHYSGHTASGESFGETQKRIDDLERLVTVWEYTYRSIETGHIINMDTSKKIWSISNLPTDYMSAVGDECVIFDNSPNADLACWKDKHDTILIDNIPRYISSIPISPISKKILNYKQELINSLSDYHYHNGQATPICVWSNKNDKVTLYTDGNYGIYKYILTYLKTPTKITSGSMDTKYEDFPEYAWREIIKTAVQLALENIGDPRYQTAAADVMTME